MLADPTKSSDPPLLARINSMETSNSINIKNRRGIHGHHVEGEFIDFEDMWLWLLHMEERWAAAKERSSVDVVVEKLTVFHLEVTRLSDLAIGNMHVDPREWINSDQSLEIWRGFIEALSGEQGQISR